MASLATLHHVTHTSSSSHHTTLHSTDHSSASQHIGGTGHTMHAYQTNPTLHSTSHPVNSPIGGATHSSPVHSIARGELHPKDFPHYTGYPTNHSTTPTTHSLGMDHKGGDLNLHVNDKGYSIGGKDCFGNAHDTICVGGNYSNTWGSHANGGGMASITWSHQW